MHLSKEEIQKRNLPDHFEYELIPYSNFHTGMDTNHKYGLIYACTDTHGYINELFLSGRNYDEYPDVKSWLFQTSGDKKVKFDQDGQPLTETLNIKEYIYLVSFTPFVSRYTPDKPTVNFKNSITILKAFTKNQYSVLSIQTDGLACADRWKTLETFFNNQDYIGFLTSDAFREIQLCDFSSTIREKALICSSKVLFPGRDVPIVLDDMRNSLIETEKSNKLGEIWQNHLGIYRDEIVDACANNALFTFSQPEDNRLICQALNDVRNRKSINNQYSGLFDRFSLAYDALTPQINLLHIVTESNHKTRVKYLNKYCDWVQNLHTSPHTSPMCKDWDAPQKLFSLTELIQATFKIFKGFTLPEATITKIASTYLDTGNFDKLGELLDTIDPRKESSVSTLWKIYQNFDAQTEENVRLVFHLLKHKPDAIGPQFYQKMVALLWDKFHNQTILPESFLRFLAWNLKFDTQYNSVDESISYQFSLIFGQREKQRQLVRSLGTICELLPTGNAMYALASYTVYCVAKELGEADLPIQCAEAIDQYGETLVEETLNNLENSNLHEQSDISVQLNTLRYGRIYKRVLEEHRTAYIRTFMLENHSMQQWEGTLAHLYSAGLYDTFIGVYRHYVEKFHGNRHENNVLFEKFVNSHIRLGRFSQSVEIVHTAVLDDPDDGIKNSLLIQILAENFKVNQLTEPAFALFNNHFTLDSAYELLWVRILKSRNLTGESKLVNSLIAIYCHRKEFCKALYLYSIFQPHFEKGYRKLYEAIRKSFADLWSANRANNYYNVIQWSFICLNATDLYDFFCWINQIAIPHFTELDNISHPLKYHYDQLREAPTQRSHWYNFEKFLMEKLDQNLWSIIVCETLLRDKLQNSDATPSGKAIEQILARSDKFMPQNMIPYILSFLQASSDEGACEKIILKLTDILNSSITGPDARDRLFTKNPWNTTYQEDYVNFKNYVLEHTQNQKYIPLLRLLPMELDSKDLEALAKQPNSFRQMIPSLCQNYLSKVNSKVNLEETFKYLNDLDQQKFDYQEKQLWEIMRVLFGDDGSLQANYPLLFEKEEDISQLKADIACILQQYPNKDALYAFARNPNSEWKMIVFSFVFRVMYDEAIYKQPVFELTSAEIPPETMCAFLHYLKTSYTAQLHHNTGFEHFYKVWRYLKLYIVECLLTADGNSDTVNDDHIIAMMQALGHEKSIYDSEYRPFKSAVNQLINKIRWDWDVTKRLLLAICQGEFNWFLEYCSQNGIQVAEEQQGLIQAVLSRLDYREAARAVYERYYNALKNGSQDTEAARVGAAVSPYIATALDSLKGLEKEQQLLLLKPAISRSAGACTYQILQNWSEEYAKIQVLILFSRQFPFQIYKAVRNHLLDRPKQNKQLLKNFALCREYIPKQEKDIFDSVYAYLCTFRYCLLSTVENKEQNIEKAKQERRKILENRGIPHNWLPELKQMDAYMNGEVDTFRPLAINDSSLLSSGDTQYTFIEMLATKLGVAASPQNPLLAEAAVEKHKQYQDSNLPWTERLKNGVSLLVDYPVAGVEKNLSCDELRLDVGLNAIKADDIGLTMNDKLDIAAELYAGYEGNIPSGNSTMSGNFNEVTNQFGNILPGISLSAWVKHGDRIIKHSEWKPSDPRTLVLGKLKKSQDSACSNEKRLGIFKACLRSLSNSEPLYRAIENEINRINCGIRLQVSLCGKKNGQVNSTDGFVYYQIYNVGKQKVSLNNVNIMLKKGESTGLDDISKYGSNIEGINELHCKFWTGGRVKLDQNTKKIKISLVDEESKIVFSDVSANVTHTPCSQPFAVDDETRYETEYAVQNSEMLFGRESKQKAIITMLKKKCVVTICGPSRIGKTSLMNWIRTTASKEFAQENEKTVLMLSFGGEGGCGADTDYHKDFGLGKVTYKDEDQPGTKMSAYLLAQTIVRALSDMNDRQDSAPWQEKRLTSEQTESIINHLKDTNMTLPARYKEVNGVLNTAGVELWLMLDEFQQVVAQWQDPGPVFATMIKQLAAKRYSNIRLILCGSDDLLLHMTSHLESEWKNLLHTTVVQIGPLERKHFCNMMKEIHDEDGTNLLEAANVTYSGAALDALYKFTGGVAIYGKEIGNVILENIQSNATNRNTIYVSDVVEAVQKLLQDQKTQLSTAEVQGISRVFDAVTNRMEREKLYLWYMALWLSENPNQDSFPDSAFSEKKLRNPNEKGRALAVAEARNLIKNTGSPGDIHYQFTTIFYYNAFLGTVRSLRVGDIFEITRDRFEELVDIMNELPDDKKQHALVDLKNKFPAAFEFLEKNVTHNYYNGTVYQIEGGVTINVQNVTNITNIFNQIVLSGSQEGIQKQLESLPGVSDYLPEWFKMLNSEDNVTDEQKEQVLEKATSKMVSDYLSALVSSDNSSPKDFCIWTQLGIDERKFNALSAKISSSYLEDLKLAAKLDYIYSLATTEEEASSTLDFSPAAIMYCKLYEKAIKSCHTSLYSQYFGWCLTGILKNKREKWEFKFKELTDPHAHNEILLGKFYYPLDPDRFNQRWDKPTQKWVKLKEADWESDGMMLWKDDQEQLWKCHGKIFNQIKEIRNKSAHGKENYTLTKDDLSTLKKLLFEDGGLQRIVELRDKLMPKPAQ